MKTLIQEQINKIRKSEDANIKSNGKKKANWKEREKRRKKERNKKTKENQRLTF